MKNISTIAVLLTMLAACSTDETSYTWGAAVNSVSEAWCTAAERCGYFDGEDDVEEEKARCVLHNNFHMCVQQDSCGVEIGGEAEVVVDQCVSDIVDPSFDCAYLYWGITPESCYPFFDYNPAE